MSLAPVVTNVCVIPVLRSMSFCPPATWDITSSLMELEKNFFRVRKQWRIPFFWFLYFTDESKMKYVVKNSISSQFDNFVTSFRLPQTSSAQSTIGILIRFQYPSLFMFNFVLCMTPQYENAWDLCEKFGLPFTVLLA